MISKSILLGIVGISSLGFLVYGVREYISSALSGGAVTLQGYTIAAFALYFVIRSASDAYAVALASANHINSFLVYMPIQALMSIIFQFYLGRYFGPAGVISGIAASFVMTALWINPWQFHRLKKPV